MKNPTEPPPALTQGAAALWRSIIESAPPDRFTAGDMPLLSAYCIAADRKNQVDEMIASEGFIVEHAGFRLVNGCSGESNMLGELLVSLATKLRIASSSTYRADSAKMRQGKSDS